MIYTEPDENKLLNIQLTIIVAVVLVIAISIIIIIKLLNNN